MKLRIAALMLMALCRVAHAVELADDAAVREQIKHKREAVEAQHAQREEACRHQFVVTTCLDKARIERQEALRDLRSQELVLDDAQRHQRAAEQAQRVAEKMQAAQERGKAASSPQAGASSARVSVAPGPSHATMPHKPQAPKPDRHAQEQASREAFDARQKEIRAHRKAVEERNPERAKHKPPTPLPMPTPLPASGAMPQ